MSTKFDALFADCVPGRAARRVPAAALAERRLQGRCAPRPASVAGRARLAARARGRVRASQEQMESIRAAKQRLPSLSWLMVSRDRDAQSTVEREVVRAAGGLAWVGCLWFFVLTSKCVVCGVCARHLSTAQLANSSGTVHTTWAPVFELTEPFLRQIRHCGAGIGGSARGHRRLCEAGELLSRSRDAAVAVPCRVAVLLCVGLLLVAGQAR